MEEEQPKGASTPGPTWENPLRESVGAPTVCSSKPRQTPFQREQSVATVLYRLDKEGGLGAPRTCSPLSLLRTVSTTQPMSPRSVEKNPAGHAQLAALLQEAAMWKPLTPETVVAEQSAVQVICLREESQQSSSFPVVEAAELG